MHALLRNLELILTLAGLVVILGVTAIAEHLGVDRWLAAGVTAIAVGVIHGLLFWVIRSRQRNVREEAIEDIQAMPSDIINNQLTVIEAAQSMGTPDKDMARISDSVRMISASLKNLSEESLRKWQTRYQRTANS